MKPQRAVVLRMFLGLALACFGCDFAAAQIAARTWTIDGVEREAVVVAPSVKSDKPSPLVFGFHGHGGSMRNAARSYDLHNQWPEAVVVYMQGLNTPGRLTDPEGKKPGWQSGPGDQNDRDLKFFDAVLATVKKDFTVDETRIYSTGHSNGGGFTYLLWETRGDLFAAMAPSAAAALRSDKSKLKPKPIIHIAGENDPLVKYAWQSRMIESIKAINGCSAEGKPWKSVGDLTGTMYDSSSGTPLITLIHPGGHEYARQAPALIVEFFKQHSKK